jgi:uncharacterized protein YdaT
MTMRWTGERFPAAMRDLDPEIRGKAVEFANALLREGHDEELAIRLAISRAVEWGRLQALLISFRRNGQSH